MQKLPRAQGVGHSNCSRCRGAAAADLLDHQRVAVAAGAQAPQHVSNTLATYYLHVSNTLAPY